MSHLPLQCPCVCVCAAVDLQDKTPVMTKIYSTLGRKFNKKDLEDAQRMGTDLVSVPPAGIEWGRGGALTWWAGTSSQVLCHMVMRCMFLDTPKKSTL